MYSNVKSTGLPLGLFSTLMFSGNSCLPVFIIPLNSRLFCNYRILLESPAAIGVYIGVGFGFGEI